MQWTAWKRASRFSPAFRPERGEKTAPSPRTRSSARWRRVSANSPTLHGRAGKLQSAEDQGKGIARPRGAGPAVVRTPRVDRHRVSGGGEESNDCTRTPYAPSFAPG